MLDVYFYDTAEGRPAIPEHLGRVLTGNIN